MRELLHYDHSLGGGVADLDEIDAGGGHVEDGGLLGVEGGADEAAEVVEDADSLVGGIGDEDLAAVGGDEGAGEDRHIVNRLSALVKISHKAGIAS